MEFNCSGTGPYTVVSRVSLVLVDCVIGKFESVDHLLGHTE